MKSKKEVAYLLIIVGLFIYIIFQKDGNTSVYPADLNLRLESPVNFYVPRTDSLVSMQDVTASSEYTLLIYLTARDCFSCLQEFKIWNRLTQEYPVEKLQIVGIYPAADETEVLSSAVVDSMRFQLYRDPGDIRPRLQIYQTPSKVLFGPYGFVRFFDGPHQQRHYQKQVYTAISSIVGVPINKAF